MSLIDELDVSQIIHMLQTDGMVRASKGEQPHCLVEATAAGKQLWSYLYPAVEWPVDFDCIYFTPVWEKYDPWFSQCCRARTGLKHAPDSLIRIAEGLPIIPPIDRIPRNDTPNKAHISMRRVMELNQFSNYDYMHPSENMPEWFWDKWHIDLQRLGVVATVAHEFVHVRWPAWNHNEQFWFEFDKNMIRLTDKE